MERAGNFGSGLINIGMKPGQSTFVGIYAQNCLEWIIAEHGCYNQSMVNVPLYDTLGPSACSFIIKEAEIPIVICDKEEKVFSLLQNLENCPCLKHIVVINNISQGAHELAEKKKVSLHMFHEIEESGMKNPAPTVTPSPSDIATICYTSGTTGEPKGAMISHYNLTISTTSMVHHLGSSAPHKEDVYLSFLPLAHLMERQAQLLVLINGGRIGFYSGDISLLFDDLKTLKPTFLVIVPRLLNKIHEKFTLLYVLRKGPSVNLYLEQKWHLNGDSTFDDSLIFKGVRQLMGGRIRFVLTAGAPLSESIHKFFRCALNCVVVQGYGQTELTGACTCQLPEDQTVGNVGPPLPDCEIKLLDVAEMGYFASNNQGEVCVRAQCAFQGYFKKPEQTKEVIDQDKWLHTGDIGMWLPNGTLKIIDRKKNIFKLSQGEYIVPEKIESIYLTSKFISQIFVYGDSLQSWLVGIAVPDKDALLPWCQSKSIKGTWKEICENKDVVNFILADVTKIGKEAGLKSFEQVKAIYLHPEPITVESGLLTPTMKTKRTEFLKYFSFAISNMYSSLS
ncbi:long-chain-fatty-acid--CoA ligase 5-like [Stegodyphus dumicola]|uniref:long-chain-fatty-acid--CoA ligase 5-like n=1 Tax=Stegodyphus dumicola TaxID=202533 RepID=UPI0015AEBF0A|nr:long-chain-fatty-acid--CoA ligase 5-like [Stegodyphus dumicola]